MSGAVLARLASSPAARAWLPVAILPPILLADSLISAEGPDVTALGVLAAFAGCLPLVLRSRLGFPALAPLLVPSLMGLMGKWNWWAPAPLARLHDRIGLTEAPAAS